MTYTDKWKEKGKDKFTRFWAWLYYNPVEEVDEISTWSGDRTVYQFSSDSILLGQATLANTILLNQKRLSSLSGFTQKVVVEHEVGHLERSDSLRGLLIGLVFWLAAGLLGIALTAGLIILVPFGFPIESVIKPAVLSIALISVAVLGFRLEEMAADFHVLQYISYDEYRTVKEEIAEINDASGVGTYLTNLFYAHPETVIQIHKFIEQRKSQLPAI